MEESSPNCHSLHRILEGKQSQLPNSQINTSRFRAKLLFEVVVWSATNPVLVACLTSSVPSMDQGKTFQRLIEQSFLYVFTCTSAQVFCVLHKHLCGSVEETWRNAIHWHQQKAAAEKCHKEIKGSASHRYKRVLDPPRISCFEDSPDD